jgi:hypothetical protein
MMRLGALLLATLAGLFLVLWIWGEGDLRANRRPVPDPQPPIQEAEPLPQSLVLPEPEPTPAAVVQVESQTPERIQRFPGPALRPSPEHAGDKPAPLAADGPVLYVTGDRVNMRTGPSTGDRVVTSLVRGTAVQALGTQDAEWVNIRDAGGRTGYVAGRFLSPDAP